MFAIEEQYEIGKTIGTMVATKKTVRPALLVGTTLALSVMLHDVH